MIWLCMRVLLATLPPGIADFASRWPVLSPDIRVFTYNLAVALAAALLCGLVPAMQAPRTNLIQVAQGEFANAFRPSRFRNALVVGQVTVCVLLLITTGILLRGIKQVKNLDGSLSVRETIEIAVQEKFRGAELVARWKLDLLCIGAQRKSGGLEDAGRRGSGHPGDAWRRL